MRWTGQDRALGITAKAPILIFAHDPGGANAVAAVAAECCRRQERVWLYGHGPALHRYALLGLEGQPLPEEAEESSVESMAAWLSRDVPRVVVTGTSGDDFHERHLWLAARQLGIPTVAVLDQWSNFGLRFSPYGLSGRDSYLAAPAHPFLPDYIMVMDEEARSEMIEDGLPPERVIISGQPYFDILAARRFEYTGADVTRLRRQMGISADEKLLAFISESIRQDYPVPPGELPYWGYDEISIFEELAAGLAPLLEAGCRLRLAVKQHPLERDNGYMELAAEFEGRYPGLKIDVVKDIDPHDLLMASDLVCGMSSMLLLEALIMDKPAMSVQIGLSRENPLILESRGIMKSIQCRAELPAALAQALGCGLQAAGVESRDAGGGTARTAPAWHYKPGAAGIICDFVEGLLCRD